MSIHGVDISKWQGDEIDWKTVGRSQIRFIVMKATQSTRIDPEFLDNWRDCALKAPHIIRGAYHLIELDEPVEPQVRAFLGAVPGEGWPERCLPPFLDIETSKIDEIPDNPQVDLDKILEFCRRVEHAIGIKPVLYMSPRGLRHLDGHTQGLEDYQLWHVEYVNGEPSVPKVPDLWEDWLFWQYTSSGDDPSTELVETGRSFGFESGGLDLDLFNGTQDDLEFLAARDRITVDAESALAYNASRGYSPELTGDILGVAKAHPWDTAKMINTIALWQLHHGLVPDGMVGPQTLKAMKLR